MKSKSKQATVKIEDLLVISYDDWLSYGQDILPVCGWETFQTHWLRRFIDIYIKPKGRYICSDSMVF